MPHLSHEPDRTIERTSIDLSTVVDQGGTYSTRAFGELTASKGYAAWLQFQLHASGQPTVSTDRFRVPSASSLSKWARGLDEEQLRAQLAAALSRWKRGQPFQPRLLKTKAAVTDQTGALYDARVFCEQDGHLYVAWLEFEPCTDGPILVTGHETSQPALASVAYWLQGLEELYYQGALDRARWWSSLSDTERDVRRARTSSPHL